VLVRVQLGGRNLSRTERIAKGLALLFMTGGGLTGLALGRTLLREGETRAGWVAILVGSILLSGSALLLYLSLRLSRIEREQDRLREAHPTRPWLWRADWTEGSIGSRAQLNSRFFWSFAVIWNAMAAPMAIQGLAEIQRGNELAAIALLFPVAGIALLGAALWSTAVSRRYGRSVFLLDTRPGILGGRLRGTIVLPAIPRPESVAPESPAWSDARARLSCLRQWHDREESDLEELWHDEVDVTHAPTQTRGHGAGVPIKFRVPVDLPASSPLPERVEITWLLTFFAVTPGIDPYLEFTVPVFDGPTGDPSQTRVCLEAERVRTRADEALPHLQGIRLRQLQDSRLEAEFPAGRAFTTGLIHAFIAAGMIAAAEWLQTTNGLGVASLVLALIGMLFTWGTLSSWFGSTRVRIGTKGLELRRMLFGLGRTRMIPKWDIAGFEARMSPTTSRRRLHDIYLLRQRSWRLELGTHVASKREALDLITAMERALGVPSEAEKDAQSRT